MVDTEKEQRRHNRRLAKKRVQWLNEALCFVSSSVLTDSSILRNPLLRQAPNRQAVKKPPFLIILQIIHTPKQKYSRSTASYFLGSKL